MVNAFEFNAKPRQETGTSASRRLRYIEERIPATVYGAGKKPQAITLAEKEALKAISNEAVFSHILTLAIDGKREKVVIKNLQRHHIKPTVNHIDFMRIKATEKITMNVPLHFLNVEACPGIKNSSGVASHLINEIEIRCLPADLPEYIAIDASHLKLDESLHLSDIQLPKGIELTHELDEEHDLPILSVYMPKTSKEDIEAEATEAAIAEEAAAEASEETEKADTEATEEPAENTSDKDKKE